MKRKKKYIYLLIITPILIWFFSGFVNIETKDIPIKKIIKTDVLYLFGKKRICSFDKSIEHYNKKGLITREDWYKGGKNIYWSYIYEYTNFDSLKRVTKISGNNLPPANIKEYKYDDFNRLIEESDSRIDKKTKEPTIWSKDIFYYDSLGRNYKTEMDGYTFLRYYNTENKIISSLFITPNDSSRSNYRYDKNGYLRHKYGGLTKNNIFYKTNEKGQITKKTTNSYLGDEVHEYYYDKNGNKTKAISDADNSHRVYDIIYDKNNRITKELSPWALFGLIRGCVEYEFQYYLE